MGFKDLFENLTTTTFPSPYKHIDIDIPEDDDEYSLGNDIRVTLDDLAKDGRELVRDTARDIADGIGSDARDKLENIFEFQDKVTEKAKNLGYSILNPRHKGGKSVSANDLHIGNHIYVINLFPQFTHHGIYVGDGKVIHYSLDGNICIHVVTFDSFASGREVYRMNKALSPTRYSGKEIVERANSRVYEKSYNLVFNNCENFVRWCRFGD